MWISRKKWEALEERVCDLERKLKFPDVVLCDQIPRSAYGDPRFMDKYSMLPSVAIRAILDHLELMLTKTEAQPAQVKLVKAPKK